MSKIITKSVDTEIGKSYTNMVADVDKATISISYNEITQKHIFRAKVNLYVTATALSDGKKAVQVETIQFEDTLANVSKDPFAIIDVKITEKYKL